MPPVDPVPGAPTATARLPDGVALVVADYHAGIESTLRRDGVEVESRATQRREQLLGLCRETDADRVVFLGDLGESVGEPAGEEREELRALVDALPVPATLVPGNHDGGVADLLGDDLSVADAAGVQCGDVGFAHGHTWPDREVLAADVVCIGHEHPAVRVEDTVGGSRVERAWLRGRLAPAPFEEQYRESLDVDAELVIFPAFNDLSGGTWVNVDGQEFLSPFLPDALPAADAYLLDGTNLGDYRSV